MIDADQIGVVLATPRAKRSASSREPNGPERTARHAAGYSSTARPSVVLCLCVTST